MEVWIVRHGETVGNVTATMQGQTDGELTEIGKLQAKIVGLRLSKVKFDDIYCSDLGRTKQTLNEIYSFHLGTNIIYEKKIREKSGGLMEGRPIKDTSKIAELKKIPLRQFRPFLGENLIDVYVRSQEFLNDLIVRYINPHYSNSKFEEFKLKYLESNQEFSITEEEIKLSKTFLNKGFSIVKDEIIKNELECLTLIEKNDDLFSNEIKNKESINFEKTEKILSDQSKIDKLSAPYDGFVNETDFRRILVISHGGFIMELLNAVRTRTNKELRYINDAKNTSLYILKINCEVCGLKCLSTEKCELKYDFLIQNSVSHLEFLVKDN